jgi:hypothetical protein
MALSAMPRPLERMTTQNQVLTRGADPSAAHTGAKSIVTSDGRRFAGIDVRTVKPALLVLALAALMSIVLPSIDRETPYRNALRTGDIAELGDGITLVPTPGWDLATGALVGHTRTPVGSTATTELVDAGVDFYVQAAPFAGTPLALLRRVNKINAELDHARGSGTATRSYTVRTRQGVVGTGEDFVGVTRQGSVVAFVFASPGQSIGEGVEVVVAGPNGPISRRRDDIAAMIRSIRIAS